MWLNLDHVKALVASPALAANPPYAVPCLPRPVRIAVRLFAAETSTRESKAIDSHTVLVPYPAAQLSPQLKEVNSKGTQAPVLVPSFPFPRICGHELGYIRPRGVMDSSRYYPQVTGRLSLTMHKFLSPKAILS